MTQQGVRWTADQVLALAPDASSRKAGSRLGEAGPWSRTGAGERALWGLCKGSGKNPYQTVVDFAGSSGPAFKCSCPSRKFPCKHALGLLLLWSSGESGVPGSDEVPDWAGQWLSGRRERAGQRAAPAAATPEAEEATRRKAQSRAARRADRITAGVEELEERLSDLLRGGIASAEQAGYGWWDETAARMVDAQAPGLASRVRELGAVAASGPGWPVRLLEECALLHLLDRAWQRRDELPEGQAASVRSRIGLTPPVAGEPERDRWLVLSQSDSAAGHLTTRKSWLYGAASGRTALLLSFGAAGRAPTLALPVGLTLDAEVSWREGPVRQRAELGEQFDTVHEAVRPPGVAMERALAEYGAALRDDPWLDAVPVALGPVVPVPGDDGWQLADPAAGTALPVARGASAAGLWRLASVSGGEPVTVFGECGHRGFLPLAVWPAGAREADGTRALVTLC
ncbi:SWIM zinc finger family protein [Streptomyces sp. NPDC050560]|uniref:SWIM zinc finger family protein n=1 Tax=Streptomyces sp. NPDC050560 TaxID=3365630 RepID=UPI00379E1D13